MKVAVSADGPFLDASIDSRFGTCPWYVLVDLDDMSYEGVPNLKAKFGFGDAMGSARLVKERGVSVVLTGSCEPNAREALAAARVAVLLGCQGGVREQVNRYKTGALRLGKRSDVPSHLEGDRSPTEKESVVKSGTGGMV